MGVSRRDLLKTTVTGAALHAAGVTQAAVNKLIPYVTPPEKIEPGEWVTYATTCRECPAGCGMHVLCRDGRALKAEGNPNHPVNMGGLCPRGQSSVQGLYHPDRLKKPYNNRSKQFQSWDEALRDISLLINSRKGNIYILSDLQTSTQREVNKSFLKVAGAPQSNLLVYEPFDYPYLRKGYMTLLGESIIPYVDLSKADLIISIYADFLESWISNVQFARQFMEAKADFNRACKSIYLGPRLSMTAANCDEFFTLMPGSEIGFVCGVTRGLLQRNRIKSDDHVNELISGNWGTADNKAVSRTIELIMKSKSPVFLVGPNGAAGSYSDNLGIATTVMNNAIGAMGKVIEPTRRYALSDVGERSTFEEVISQVRADDVVLICNCNIAYVRPVAFTQLRKAGTIVYAGVMHNETSQLADYSLPLDHFLETWGDYEPYNGLISIIQPVMQRLYDSRNFSEILTELMAQSSKQAPPNDWPKKIEKSWGGSQEVLKMGFVEVPVDKGQLNTHPKTAKFNFAKAQNKAGKLHFYAYGSVLLFDGRVANRPWLQENPEPLSSAVWSSFAEINPKTAAKLGFDAEHEIEITSGTAKMRCGVLISENVAEDVVAVRYGEAQGANAFAVTENHNDEWFFPSITIKQTAHKSSGVLLQATMDQYNSEAIRWARISELKSGQTKGEDVTLPLPAGYKPGRDLYKPHEHRNHRWAMVTDINRCIGCQACAIACYAENNIAVMGKEALRKGREMAWIKVVPYKEQGGSRIAFLPMFCQHCDAAPCEPVCPVFAAVHNEEGLNAQIYNRCIGTRYCSNNCPYKVRRFNWFNTQWAKPLEMQLNPEVTVRSRGVMEKCTFCIQRIRQVEHRARRENRSIRDGEVQPACVQSCPTRALIFGDLLDANSEVTKLTLSDARRYHVLEELNTKPAVTYLKRVINDM